MPGRQRSAQASSPLQPMEALEARCTPSSATANNIVLNGGDLLGSGTFTLNVNRGIGIGSSSGSTGGTGLIDAAASQVFTIGGIIASAGNTGTNNLTVNSGAGDTGTVVLSGCRNLYGHNRYLWRHAQVRCCDGTADPHAQLQRSGRHAQLRIAHLGHPWRTYRQPEPRADQCDPGQRRIVDRQQLPKPHLLRDSFRRRFVDQDWYGGRNTQRVKQLYRRDECQ